MYYVCLLLLKNFDIYTGSTGDLKERIATHERGGVQSTRYSRPLKLIHYEAYLLKEDAQRRERFLKTSDGKRFLKQQLSVLFRTLDLRNKRPPLVSRP